MRVPTLHSTGRIVLFFGLTSFGILPLSGHGSLQAQIAAPSIESIAPLRGSTSPGIQIMVHGHNFSQDAVVYFDGRAARNTAFIDSTTLEVTTPYIPPSRIKLQLESGGATVRTEVFFTSEPSLVDQQIDRALALARRKQIPSAIEILTRVAKTNADYQVRSFAYYEIGQVYLGEGDLWRWAGVPIFLNSDKAGAAVQTYWPYRMADVRSTYLLPMSDDPDAPLRLADFMVEKDVTQNPEPRFFRALLNARFGNLAKAKAESDFILRAEAENLSYQALVQYIAALAGQDVDLSSFRKRSIGDARALSLLGQTAYLIGDHAAEKTWWSMERKLSTVQGIKSYWAGRKHLKYGQDRVAIALLTECVSVAPDSKEAKEAEKLIAAHGSPAPPHND